jgi:hypothetical protein
MDASAFKAHGFMTQPVVDGNPGRGALDGGFHQPIGDPDPMVRFEPTAGIGQHLPGTVMVNIDCPPFPATFKGGGVDRFDICSGLSASDTVGTHRDLNPLSMVSAPIHPYRNFSLICAAYIST